MNLQTGKYLRFDKNIRGLVLGSGLAVFLAVFTILIHSALGDTRLGADFYTFWLAGKALFLERSNPYSPEVTLQSQVGIYGRPATAGEDQVAFAYPPFSLLPTLPTLLMTFDWAYAFWLALNILGFLTLLFFLFRPASRPLSLTAILFYPVFICCITGNFSIMIAGTLLLFFGLAAQPGNFSATAQVFTALGLAWAAAKPQFIWLFTIFILLFAVKQRLYVFLGAYFISLAVFLAISFAYVPGWVTEWVARIQMYAKYVHSRPVVSELLGAFLPEQPALFLGGTILGICGGLTAWFFYRWWKGKMSWLNMLAWVGLVTYLSHLHGIAYEQMTFLAPLLLWAGVQERRKTWPGLVFWFGSLIFSWLAFAGGLAIPSGPLSLAADRSPVLFNAVWVAWLLLSQDGPSIPSTFEGVKATRISAGENFQV